MANNNTPSTLKISLRQKIVLVIFGVLTTLVLLEIGMRLGGFIILSSQELRNMVSIRQRGEYRIMCIGESTTAGSKYSYPGQLEEILNKRNIGIRFSVINKGLSGTNTPRILAQLEDNLNKYKPDMVIAMMGINDSINCIPPEGGSGTNMVTLFSPCFKIYKLIRLIKSNIMEKIKERVDYNNTERQLKAAIKANPKEEKRYIALGFFYIERVGLEKAKRVLRRVLALKPNNEEARTAMGWIYGFENKFTKAEEILSQAIEFNSKNESAYLILARLYQRQNKNARCEEVVKKVINLNPGNTDAYIELAGLYVEQEEYGQAEEVLKKCMQLNPNNERPYLTLTELYGRQGRIDKLEEVMKNALALNPKSSIAYFELGWIYESQNKFDAAEEMLKKAQELNPQNDLIYIKLGQLYAMGNKIIQAQEAFRKALTLNPKRDRAYIELSWIYEIQERFDAAQEMRRKAEELNPCVTPYNVLSYDEIEKYLHIDGYAKITNKARSPRLLNYSYVTINNYRKLKKILDEKGIRLVCVQYPIRSVEALKKIFNDKKGVIFVDNERVFKEAVKKTNFREYFKDMFGVDFGHCTLKGNRLLADNIASTIIKDVFNK